jgi:competence protein ComEC
MTCQSRKMRHRRGDFPSFPGMKRNDRPILIPALALAAGASLAPLAPDTSMVLLAALSVLGLALRRRTGVVLACLAVGALAGRLHPGPADSLAGLDLERPVTARVRLTGHATPEAATDPGEDSGWSVPTELLRAEQGAAVAAPELPLLLRLPGAEPPPSLGATLRVRGEIRRSSGYANREPIPPGPWRMRLKSRLLMEVEAPPGWAAALSASLRRRADIAFRAAGPESAGKGLARALVLGDVGGMPETWKRGLRVTGLYHLLSVSGVHVAIVAGVIWRLGLLLPGAPRALRLLATLGAIVLYLLLVGPQPALIRSAVMGALAILALLAERPPAAANALGWAIALLVLDRPEVVGEPSFQLTAAATLGILTIAPALARRWTALPHWLRLPLAASVGAELATMPWLLPRFHAFAPLAALWNLAAVPWTGVALGACLIWAGLAFAVPSWAAALVPVLNGIAAPFAWPANLRPEPWISYPLAVSPVEAWLLTCVIGLVLLGPPSWLRGRAALAGALLLLAVTVSAGWPVHHDMELAMLDVGQGDAILLRDGRRAILVDGGGWRGGDLGARVLLPALLGEGIRRLDAVVMTHPDLDHCGGLVDIAGHLPVAEVWMGPGWPDESCAGRLRDLPGVRTRILADGSRAALGRWRFCVLHPPTDDREGTNERSLVVVATAWGKRFLLTGDSEHGTEEHLVETKGSDLHADILKIAHHGSSTSSTDAFLDAVHPRLALISVGIHNLYHHPSPKVLERLEERRVRVLRTDRDGEIVIHLSDRRLRIELPGGPR